MNFLNRLFKRETVNLDDYEIPSYYDELTEMICDFIEKNNNDHLTTQIILANGKSVLVSHDLTIRKIPRGAFISVYDKDDVEVAVIRLNDISALGRVPKGKSMYGV